MIKRSENGTPQYSIFSPILFSIMINDLPGTILSLSALCMPMISGFGKVGPMSNNSKTSDRHLSPGSIIGAINLVLKSLHPKPLQFFSRKRENLSHSN